MSSFLNVVAILTITAMVSGCSNKEIYNFSQPGYGHVYCKQYQGSKYQECLQQKPVSYDEYQKQRQELLDDSNG